MRLRLRTWLAITVSAGLLLAVLPSLVAHGFDLQVNDATAGARTAVHTWQDPTGLSYLNTSRWGVVCLIG